MVTISSFSEEILSNLNFIANKKKEQPIITGMSLTAIECPNGICHSHHGGHSISRKTMKRNLQTHGEAWCERLAERIYEMSVDTYSQTVMPSLHASGWQRRHLNWEFKLEDDNSEPDETLVEGMINATESFLRSSEVHRLFIQELVQGTFAEATENSLRSIAVKKLIENEVLAMLDEHKDDLLDRVASCILDEANGEFETARGAASEGLEEVEKLLINHSESL